MVTLSLKLCNSNCLDSRCTEQKLIRSLKNLKDMQSIFTKGHMKSSLDVRPSTFSDSLFGTVCFFLFVDLPNLTAACAAQVAKQSVFSSFRHGYTFWCCSFRNRGLVTILLHLYLYSLHHISSRITRFLLRFCVSIQCVHPCLTSQQICKRKVSLISHQHL